MACVSPGIIKRRALAGHAVLWIKDGPDEQRFELDSKQLSEGSVTYWPKNSDVTFRLESCNPPPAPLSLNLYDPSEGRPKRCRSFRRRRRLLSKRPPPLPSRPPVPPYAHRSARTATTGSDRPRGSFPALLCCPLPETASAAVTPTRLPDPPAIRQAAVAPALEHNNKEFLKPIVPAHGLESADSSIHVRVEPVPVSRLERLTRSLPLIGKRYRRPDYVPPAALRNPGLTSPPPRGVSREVNIDVKVYVNPAGKVDYSEVLSKVAEPDRDLAASAVFSARRWEFVPARDSDGTVPGEVILHYQFAPGTRLAR